MDTGGLAHMALPNHFQPAGAIATPGAGFASRGKAGSLKRLSVAAPSHVAVGDSATDNPTPRTSRSHLLAGLRTAPKTPSNPPPASAPFHQPQHALGRIDVHGPQTSVGAGFASAVHTPYGMVPAADQVLAPPSVRLDDPNVDPDVAAQLLATEMYLAQRQQQLQQQLLSLTTQQLGNMHVNAPRQHAFPATPYTPSNGYHAFAGAVMADVGQNNVQVAFNPMTGQYQYVMDSPYAHNAAMPGVPMTNNLANSPPPPTPSYTASPPKANTPSLQVSPPSESNPSPWASRSASPPKKMPTPPQDVVPLPPPSANAFRRGAHKKTLSSLALNSDLAGATPKSAFTPRSSFPQTPGSVAFGPGHSREGEHPTRQPRGPPPIDELQAAPTTKHEGSKNFAARQRRNAVTNLVRAGIERRGARSDSAGNTTPVSDSDMVFPLSDDTDSVHSAASGSLSGKPSLGSLRAAANGAIGSERKERSRDRSTPETPTVYSDEPGQRRQMPLLVLTSAEKRKSNVV